MYNKFTSSGKEFLFTEHISDSTRVAQSTTMRRDVESNHDLPVSPMLVTSVTCVASLVVLGLFALSYTLIGVNWLNGCVPLNCTYSPFNDEHPNGVGFTNCHVIYRNQTLYTCALGKMCPSPTTPCYIHPDSYCPNNFCVNTSARTALVILIFLGIIFVPMAIAFLLLSLGWIKDTLVAEFL